MRGITRGVLLGTAAFATTAPLQAAVVSWVGPTIGGWHTPEHWSSNPLLPGPDDDVVIDVGGATIATIHHTQGDTVVRSVASQESLRIYNGSTFSGGAAQVLGVSTLSNATLRNTVWTGPLLSVDSNSILDRVTVNGGLNLHAVSAVRVRNGLTLNGTAQVTGTSDLQGPLRFQGSQTLAGAGTLDYGGGSFRSIDVEGNATLTIGPDFTLRGHQFKIGTFEGGQDTVVNRGTIRADPGGHVIVWSRSFVNSGTLDAHDGATLRWSQPGRSVHNDGTIIAQGGGMVSTQQNVATLGAGTIIARTGGAVFLDVGTSSLADTTVVLNNGSLQLGGTFTTSRLTPRSIQNSAGTLVLLGSVDNHGGVLDIGPLWLRGEIRGGTVTGQLNLQSGSIKDVTVNGGMDVVEFGSVSGNLTLNSTARLAGPLSILTVRGATTFSGSGTVVFSHGAARMYFDPDSTLAIAGGVTVRGFSNVSSGGVNSTVLNAGHILADSASGSLIFNPNRLVNTGTMEARNGGLLVAATVFTTSGTVEAHGGSSVVLAPQVTAQGGSIGGDGSVRVNGTLDVVGTVRKNGSGALRVNGPLMLPEGGTIDVLGGSAIIDYAAASPFGELRSKIISGFNGRAWNGSGIRSSTAAGGPRLALGYAEASALFNSFPATFAGETIDSTTVLVRLTRFGDADLSGRVDLADFNRLATHFNDPGFWTDGDFNYDGQVNLIDFNLLAANFNQSAGPDGVVDPEDWANLASAVPEPGAVGVSVAPILAARRRRRK